MLDNVVKYDVFKLVNIAYSLFHYNAYNSILFERRCLGMTPYLKIHPINFIRAMSMALELTSIGISNHHYRTTIIVDATSPYTLRHSKDVAILSTFLAKVILIGFVLPK